MINTLKFDKDIVGGILHGIIPAFLLAVSVGQIYAFTNYAGEIANAVGCPQGKVQLAFSLGIFFLGMGAAFFGKIVEKQVTKACIIGMLVFLYGLLGTAYAIRCQSLAGVVLSYGVFVGLGTGIIYISPVKTMMMWFKNMKALAAAIPIVSFGLGSTLSVMLWNSQFLSAHSIVVKFLIMAAIYAFIMTIGTALLKKPKLTSDQVSEQYHDQKEFSYFALLKDPWFDGCWLFMLLNISAGLALIPLSRQLMETHCLYAAGMIAVVLKLAGIFNGGGRLVFAAMADRLQVRHRIMVIISGMSLVAVALLFWAPSTGAVILAINMLYGAGFSVIPAILSDHYGMSNISKIHGAVLSAWGIAGLVGNQAALLAQSHWGLTGVFTMLIIAHALNIVNWGVIVRKDKIFQS